MAKNILLVCAMTVVLSSVFADCKQGDTNDNDNSGNDPSAYSRFVNTNTALTGKYVYQHLLKYPNQSYTIVTLPVLCVAGHLAYLSHGKHYKRLLNFLHMKNKKEIKEVISNAVAQINYHSDSAAKITFKVYADNCETMTYLCTQIFDDICDGDTGYLNYGCPNGALEKIIEWFEEQSPSPPETITDTDLFDDDRALIYATSMDFLTSFDHEANPNCLRDIDFYISETQSILYPSLYGNGYFKFAELNDLDAKVLLMYLKGGKHFAVFIYPNNPDNLAELMEKVRDPKVYYGIIDRAQWMCLKIHVTVGHAFVANKLTEFIPELQLNTTNFKNVFESGDSAHVSEILQQLHLIGDQEVREGELNSKLCPEDDLPFVKMDHACAYYVIDSTGMIVYAGVIYGPQNYGA